VLEPISNTLHGVIDITWPMVLISCVVIASLRISYLIKNKKKFVIYKELLSLAFLIYIMCLFQVVTFQDDVSWSSNNFIPFKEILRYNMGSRLFFKNVVGNMVMFLPYGFFVSYYLDNKKLLVPFILTAITSISIETVQLVIGRVFDVDDIILNMLGGTIGFYIYHIVDLFGDRFPKVLKNEWFLNILSILLLGGVVLVVLF
jgi:vanZ family protein